MTLEEMQKKMQEQIDKLGESVATLTAGKGELEKEIADLKAEKAVVATKLSEAEKAENSRKVEGMVEPLSAAGLAPTAGDAIKAFAEKLDSSDLHKFGEKEQTTLDAFGELLTALIEKGEDGKLVVQFGEQAPGVNGFSEDSDEKSVIDNIASAAPAPGN